MRIVNILVIFFGFGMLPLANAQSDSYKSVQAFVASMPGATLELEATGDLNDDEHPDSIVSILRGATPNQTRQIYILFGSDLGTYKVADNSGEEIACCGTTDVEFGDMEITEHSVFFSYHRRWHNCVNDTQYQYKLNKNTFKLIEVLYSSTLYKEDDDSMKASVEINKNLVTGRMVITKSKNNKKSQKTIIKGKPELFYLKDGGGLDAADYKYDPCQ
ncbi:hypothetical protein [Sulfuriferula nivalis]|uniref:Lipoprotein n=1 Tax=Sulfuriferula nivalis TaxID=2675298 RepID=A0A809S906_9PROT|nr:hypothetical protein [Sulfuriferula nivalis]BBP00582.1 hypothetical protein SFSGTM_12900 [Sulfuriferula nivalis]